MSSSSLSSGGKCRQISLDKIKEATDGFNKSNVIGKGGEAEVYLAKIKLDPDSEITPVAVKMLKTWKRSQKRLKAASKQVDEECLKRASKRFEVEIETMSKIQHHNLVSLVGYCDKVDQKMLVYEYMENGSLAHYLNKEKKISTSWQLRVSICIDAARGLCGLHAETDEYSEGIIHRDVKPDNILIDKNGDAKIADFGLLFKIWKRAQKSSEMESDPKGTPGYFAPEYISHRTITKKIDIYAFGIVLYRVLCLKGPFDQEDDEQYVFTGYEDFALLALENIDLTIKEEIKDDALKIYTEVIGQSMKRDPNERPTMKDVMSSLEDVARGLNSKDVNNEVEQGGADDDHSTGGSHREASEKGKRSEAIVLDVGGDKPKVEFDEYRNQKAVSRSHLTIFGLHELERATDWFDDAKVIVREDFAITYEGLLEDGSTVAVKRYQLESFSYLEEYLNDIYSLSTYQSDYLVSITGICEESDERILVHKFMKNRTLGYHLMEKQSTLSWDQRLRICIDAAKGLEYLHFGISNAKRVTHRNVNLFTILLDEQWRAKLSHIGFQKAAHAIQYSVVDNDVTGYIKYIDPHYNLTGRITRRTDVYSFGIVLFHVLFGMEYMEGGYMDRRNKVREWTGKLLSIDCLDKIDERLKGQISLECFKEFVEVASSCVDDYPANRPTMIIVVEKLESALNIIGKSMQNELGLKSKEVDYESKQGRAATEPDEDHSTGGSYHRGARDKGKSSEAIVLDIGGDKPKAEDKYPRAFSGSHRHEFRLAVLRLATDNFSDAKVIISGDSFRTYEGLLKDGSRVAVKRYHKTLACVEEYQNEIDLLSKSYSSHVVSIIGYCSESKELILVHEFMENRTLAYHLLNKEFTLSWDQRLRICSDTARALEYLHRKFAGSSRIIHGNLNPFTIQLDDKWGAKLSDFGFQGRGYVNPYANTDGKGNVMKYIDPHYHMTGRLTRRSDVYSFGIVLFDVLFGMEYVDREFVNRDKEVTEWTQKFLDKDSEIDERLKERISRKNIQMIVRLASRCSNVIPQMRPDMTDVLQMLEYEYDVEI